MQSKYFIDDDGIIKKKWDWFTQRETIEYMDFLARRGQFMSMD